MIGADAIIKCLEAEGVSTVFGYPGVAICPFFNSILDSDSFTSGFWPVSRHPPHPWNSRRHRSHPHIPA